MINQINTKKMAINILFIGGAGFIGSSLISRFIENENYNLFILEPESSNKDRIKSYVDKISIFQGDLNDSAMILEILVNNRINIVVHLVSTLIPGSSLCHFQNEMNNILIPTMNLMELCAERSVKLVYFSSGGTIYGNSETGVHSEKNKKEPISYYGLSKNIVEEMIKFEHRHKKLDYLILRPSNPYGFGQDIYGKQGLIAVSIGKLLNNEPLTVWGDGNSIRDYIYIDDLADAVYELIDKKIQNKVINIGSGIGYSVNDIIKILSTIVDKEIQIEFIPSRGVDVESLVLDVSKLKSLISFNPRSIEVGINMFVSQILNQ